MAVKSPEDQAILNDAIAHNARHAGGSRMIKYEDMEILAPLSDIVHGMQELEACNRDERRTVMTSVKKELLKSLPRVRNKTANQEEFMDFCGDVVIWFANE